MGEHATSTPQPGVFAQGTRDHYHLEFDLLEGVDSSAIAAALNGLHEPAVTAGGANIVVGFGDALWRRLAPADCPVNLGPFPEIAGVDRTQHDIWVWTHGTGIDVLLDVARAVGACFAGIARLASDVRGFVYHDSRDLTGFIDGTENPPVEEAHSVTAVPDDQPGAGGCFAMTQRWVHDLAQFNALPVAEQELVIGRAKTDSLELDDKPSTAHISRVVIEEDGEELEIYRRSVPYGTVTEQGLYFVAFSADPSRFEKMLRRMFGSNDGIRDRLTEFSNPVSGSYYFVPSVESLAALP